MNISFCWKSLPNVVNVKLLSTPVALLVEPMLGGQALIFQSSTEKCSKNCYLKMETSIAHCYVPLPDNIPKQIENHVYRKTWSGLEWVKLTSFMWDSVNQTSKEVKESSAITFLRVGLWIHTSLSLKVADATQLMPEFMAMKGFGFNGDADALY